jgi:hypothetical protein
MELVLRDLPDVEEPMEFRDKMLFGLLAEDASVFCTLLEVVDEAIHTKEGKN